MLKKIKKKEKKKNCKDYGKKSASLKETTNDTELINTDKMRTE